MGRSLASVTIVLTVALAVSGCDFFRSLAGRPTSKDINEKRAAILRNEVARQAEAARADSLAEILRSAQDDKIGGQDDGKGANAAVDKAASRPSKKRYYVIMGAFSSRGNAEKYAEKLSAKGYEPEFFGFTEGRTAVGIGGTDDMDEAKAFMAEIRRQDFCPGGVWILDRKKK